ncbi:sigma-E factor negative regulatory protein [Marinobacter halotolerans]|uniref:sigma-E factor negative regulatory protein n=1 Tax=Marinobacter halotolerans TaxID=1569211 RepID=UPI001247D690|nr:sigma-E factor negative regulatory protein [Marinobacter halotolerans]
MDDRLKETLSAMMDDEADELSVRRLLSHDNQDEVCTQFQRWQQVRDLIQHRHPAVDSIDVSEGVRDVLEGQGRAPGPLPKPMQIPLRQTWKWPAAAMVALALAVGFSAGAGWNSDPLQTEQAAAAAEIPDLSLQGLDEQQREQLNRYLLKHAQHNSIGASHASVGYARAVSASGTGN